jgi:hypothetical protein
MEKLPLEQLFSLAYFASPLAGILCSKPSFCPGGSTGETASFSVEQIDA